jgi:MEMO1 family protein
LIMKKYCLIFVLLFLTGCHGQDVLVNKMVSQPAAAAVHESILIDKAAIEEEFSRSTSTAATEKIFGAVVTHHVLAVSVMSDLFKSLRAQKYKTIVIVGPNHFNVGHTKIIVSGEGFKTPYGVLEPDLALAEKLDVLDDVSIDESPFGREHAITSLVSFVKKNWPEANFLPILVNFNTDEELAKQIGYKLSEYLPEDSLVIASCDFAHHVNRETAVKYDQDSLAGLNSQDLNKILKIKVDSPGSLIVLESYLKQYDAQKFQLVKNTNAADILGMLDYQDVTSYIAGHFIKNK